MSACVRCNGTGELWDGSNCPCASNDPTANYHGGSATSSEAFKRKGKAERNAERERILAALRDTGTMGMTCLDLERVLGIPHQTCSARLSSMRADDEVYVAGERAQARPGGKRKSKRYIYMPGKAPAGLPQPQKGKPSREASLDELDRLRGLAKLVGQRIDEGKLEGESADGLRKWLRQHGYA